jgi:hypothetical protein
MPDYQVKNVEPVAVGTDIQVRVFTLAGGEVIPWHYHSKSTDHYFVLPGESPSKHAIPTITIGSLWAISVGRDGITPPM